MRSWLPQGFFARTEIEVKRSRFLATLARADSEEQARGVVAQVRGTFPDARHHCLAFIIDLPDAQPIERSSDDGEPAGTAGMPMLEVLRGAELGHVVAVVTRYFGGVLLGTGGLVRAYSDAVAAVLADTPRVVPQRRILWGLDVSPAEAGRVQGALLNRGLEVVDADWGATVRLTVAVADPDAALPVVRELTQSELTPVDLGVRIVEVPLAP
ncbi:MAG TPA: YigZ family protein [Propioniciclava sp.]|jgi:uncharacterized YigZ family protein|uniref:IMPACT family protein n=1 Tax=Propioniciclava sp. TaxID=2038686 RepID=UPI002CDF24CB|nr:YigZ family protein [Propioniciclava sp.]HRL50559.1 YigZ family protein [Propioniciclava sp.]HRL78856.1 YigZ family protein [Propioniciclava sp.]